MSKSYNRFGNNAQMQGGEGWLANIVKGDCIQVHNNGLTKTKGMFSIETPSVDASPREPNYYHRPWYGNLEGKQPSGDKE